MKYKKKPVVIEAIQWTGLNLEEIKNFVGKDLEYNICDTAWEVAKGVPHILMKIKTLEGYHLVTEGDYIIKGIKGEFYPCKPDIFKETYDPVYEEPLRKVCTDDCDGCPSQLPNGNCALA